MFNFTNLKLQIKALFNQIVNFFSSQKALPTPDPNSGVPANPLLYDDVVYLWQGYESAVEKGLPFTLNTAVIWLFLAGVVDVRFRERHANYSAENLYELVTHTPGCPFNAAELAGCMQRIKLRRITKDNPLYPDQLAGLFTLATVNLVTRYYNNEA